ncbi:hypothetical protein GCM10028799_78360 [Kribbella italica]
MSFHRRTRITRLRSNTTLALSCPDPTAASTLSRSIARLARLLSHHPYRTPAPTACQALGGCEVSDGWCRVAGKVAVAGTCGGGRWWLVARGATRVAAGGRCGWRRVAGGGGGHLVARGRWWLGG